MPDENGTSDGQEAALAGDHVGNPAFFVHFNHALQRVNQLDLEKEGGVGSEALLDVLLFLYIGVLDLYRKFAYMYRATREQLSPNTPFDQDALELLRLIALNHEEIEAEKARAGERARKAKDSDDKGDRRRKLAVIEALERQVHMLWDADQDGWHRYMEKITGVPLTRPHTDDPEHRIGRVHGQRHDLAMIGKLSPEVRRADDKDSVDHRMERKHHGRAAGPRRLRDKQDEDHSDDGQRAISARTLIAPQ